MKNLHLSFTFQSCPYLHLGQTKDLFKIWYTIPKNNIVAMIP